MSDVYVYVHKRSRLGGSGGMVPQKIFLKLDALRLLLRPFWDRSRAVVAIHGSRSIASNFWLSMYAFGKPADFEFPRAKVLR